MGEMKNMFWTIVTYTFTANIPSASILQDRMMVTNHQNLLGSAEKSLRHIRNQFCPDKSQASVIHPGKEHALEILAA